VTGVESLTSPRELRDAAESVLEANWTGTSTVPSHTQYPHQWGWDAAYIAIGWAVFDEGRAEQELESILGGQWADGRVPHIRFHPDVPAGAYFPGREFWRSDEVAGAPAGVSTSGITQPPLHARAALDVYQRAADPGSARAFLERIYPALEAQLAYLRDHRDVAGDGLTAIVHPWESLDNSPLWDESLDALELPDELPGYQRADLQHVTAEHRPTDLDYDRYVYLAAWYRDQGYRDDGLARAPFVVEDPLFNAITSWSWHALAAIARILGEDPEPHERAAERVRDGLLGQLWDAGSGCFFARDLRAGELRRRRTVASLAPLLDPRLPRAVVDGLVRTLESPSFRAPGVTLGVPTYDLLAEDFDPQRYWRGPIWVNTTWLISCGLRQHGRERLADRLDRGTVELVKRSGFREYFDPMTGAGYGTDDFSWTAALLLDVLTRPPEASDR
jgi:glycogen debranching enzyme